ncbi:dephospho-CoA kinase [Breznakibacter xylanolyticus]|uniref:Dephospho-CoA kinase n=1 Tax=Breznakibacter xylanolyticus TaxID=990 RepID=A0A2W7PNN7_9BACT|nr:dephospho-CoA kinase [Breznakibacter xylanolyticus]PZX10919.1 dephospho-CoA kinase [Breznakibacter xylanolyticus]
MKIVGITGGIGSGKSTVCRIFEMLGVPVYRADDRARWLCNHHAGIQQKVNALLGPDAYMNGEYNRTWIGQKAFHDRLLLQALNQIIHPVVANDFVYWSAAFQQYPFVMKEAAILFESGANVQVDCVITVTAPIDLRLQRVMKRDTLSEGQVRARMQNQWSDELKIGKSQFVIHCDETQLVIPQVLNVYQSLIGEVDRSF